MQSLCGQLPTSIASVAIEIAIVFFLNIFFTPDERSVIIRNCGLFVSVTDCAMHSVSKKRFNSKD